MVQKPPISAGWMQDPGHIPAGFYLVQQRNAGRVYVGQAERCVGFHGWCRKGQPKLIENDRYLKRAMSTLSWSIGGEILAGDS